MNLFNSKKRNSCADTRVQEPVATNRVETVPERKLRSLTVRTGIKAGLARAGCNSGGCHNHNETLVTR